MKNKQIGHNNDNLRVNSSIIQVNSPKNTSKSKINKKPNHDSNYSVKSINKNTNTIQYPINQGVQW